MVASIDSSRTVDCDRNEYPCTVTVSYYMYANHTTLQHLQHYRATLHVCRARQSSVSDSRTSASSHAKYFSLTPMEKDKRMKNLGSSEAVKLWKVQISHCSAWLS